MMADNNITSSNPLAKCENENHESNIDDQKEIPDHSWLIWNGASSSPPLRFLPSLVASFGSYMQFLPGSQVVFVLKHTMIF